MKKNSMRFLGFLLVAMMMVSLFAVGVFAEDTANVAEVGNTEYATIEVTDIDGNALAAKANGSYTTVTPQGSNFTGYTGTDGIWGEVWGNAYESFVIKVLDANGNVMGTTSLNNVGGIIDGDVTVSWNLKLDAASNTDEYWTMEWTTAPSIDNQPAKVELWVDGVKVSGGNVVLNGPDDLNKIYAASADANGKITKYYTSLSAALAAVTDDAQTTVVLRDVTENLTGSYLRGNIVGNATITLTNSDWVYCPYTFVIGENITLNVPALFYYAGGSVIRGTVVAGAYYQRYAYTKLTIEAPGSLTVTSETFILRDMGGDPKAGIYIIGDNNDETVELKLSVAYFYQGMINAKDANLEVAVYWQTNEIDGQGSANLVLNNSKLNVTVNEHDMKVTGNTTVTLTNGSFVEVAGAFVYGNNSDFAIDSTSSIKDKNGIVNLPVAKIGTAYYATLEDAFAAAGVNDTIKLLADATPALTSQKSITNASVIDLNGHTLTLNKGDLYFGTTTFKNGTIVVDPSVKASTAVFWMFENQTLTFNGVNIVATGVSGTYLIGINGGTGTEVELLNSSITIDNENIVYLTAVICDNGTGNSVVIENSTINVANIEGRFYLGGKNGDITVTDSTINLDGVKEGFYLRAGQTLAIEGKSDVTVALNDDAGRYGINLTDLSATYNKAASAFVDATVFEIIPAAMIGNVKYASLQAAINAVQNGETIVLCKDLAENVTLTEKTGLYYTIDGNGNKMNGTITVNSLSDTNDNRRITIKNINFADTTSAKVDFITSVNTNHYPRLTVEGCTFTGNGDASDVAIRLKSSHSVIIKDCTGTGLHSFLQNTSGWNLTVENVTVTNSKGGLALGTVQGVTIQGCNIDVDGYGIRMDAQYNNNATIDSNTITAFIPVVVRKAEVDSNVTFQGTNTMTAGNTDGYWMVVGTSEYDTNGSLPTAATGKVIVTVNDTGLNAANVYGNYGVASINGVKYVTLAEAIAKAENGDTIILLVDVTLSETLVIPADKTIVLDLNGKTISQTKACTASYSMIENKGNLTITGNGKISFTDTGAGDPNFGWGTYTIYNAGTLVVENGTVEFKGNQTFGTHCSLAIFQYSGSTTINGGSIINNAYRSIRLWHGDMTINGGSFEGQVWVHCVDDSAKLTINGGTFAPAKNGGDGSSVFVNNAGKKAVLSVTGGTFTTKIGANDVAALAGAVSGGLFTETAKNNTSDALIKEGFTFGAADAEGFFRVIDDPTTLYIYTVEDLKDFRDAVNAGNAFSGIAVYLASDIDLNDEEWTPIGTSSAPFNGIFDGKNHTISNLVINGGSKSDQGFFGRTNNGEIKNLTVKNAKVSGRLNVGVVAGTPYTSKFTNIKVTGHVEVNGMAYVGGVGGKNAYADWTDITVDVDNTSYVKATSTENGTAYRTYVGGVIGFIGEGGHTFKNISSNIKVIGDVRDIGGLFGIAHYGNKFENVTFTGSVEAPEGATEVGGIAGVWHNEKGQTVTFTGVTSTGTVTVGTNMTTGSIVGGAYNANNETPATSGSLIIDGKEVWLCVAKIGDQRYQTLEDAFAAAGVNDTIKLLADAAPALTSQRAITKAAVIDLNGKTLTLNKGDLYFGTTTFVNGTIVVDPTVFASTAVFWMFENQTLTFNDVDIVATGVSGTYLIGLDGGTGTKVELLNSSIKIANANIVNLTAVICDNGTGNSVVIKNSTINVAKIEGRFYLGGTNGNITVTDSTINLNGVKEGFYLRAGQSLAIKGESDVTVALNDDAGRYGINLTAPSASYTKDEEASVNATFYKAPYKVATKAELDAALAAAKDGDVIILTADIDYGTTQLAITKAITLDLGGKTLTTRNAYGGMSVKGNPTIKNGTIVHASNTAAIKVWNAAAFEDLVIDVQGKGDANKTIGGIVLQSGTTTHVGTIKNVTIKGAALTNGIETYNCGDATKNVIGSMENVTINALGTGLLISAPCGTATNCTIKGGVNAIELWIKGNYSASLKLVDSTIEGGVFAHDEFTSNPNVVNNGTLSLTVDEKTTGADDLTVTIARAENLGGLVEEFVENAQAKIGDTYYATLQDAIDACVVGNNTITLLADSSEDVTIKQTEGVNITIDGASKTYSGTITIHGASRSDGTETLTIQNFNFVTSEAEHYFIDSNSTDSAERYAHNVTVSGCNFIANGAAENTAAGIRIRQGFNITVQASNTEGMHSLFQGYGCTGLNFVACSIGINLDGDGVNRSGKNGISVGTSTNVSMVAVGFWNLPGYGIRADGNANSGMALSACSFYNVTKPVVVRKLTGEYKLNMVACSINKGNNSGKYDVIFTAGDDDAAYTEPTGTFVYENTADGLAVYPTSDYVAYIDEKGYFTFDDAYKAAKKGDTIVLLDTIVITNSKPWVNYSTKQITVKAEGLDTAFRVQDNAYVWFGGMTIESTDGYCIIVGASDGSSGADVEIMGGTYKGNVTAISVTKGDVTINGGTFSVTPYNGSYEYTINCIDSAYKNGTADVSIKGGTFYNFDPTNNAAEGEGTNFVINGYCAYEKNGVYTVEKHDPVVIPSQDATCTEDGLTEGSKCSNCEKILEEQETVPSTGHDHESVYTAPTFDADGFTTYTCHCGDSYVDVDEGTQLIAVAEVNGDKFESIAEAINAAVNGDYYLPVIIIMPGTYDEVINVTTVEKAIKIVGSKDAEGNLLTTLTGGIYLGTDNNVGDTGNVLFRDINFTDKGITLVELGKVEVYTCTFNNIVGDAIAVLGDGCTHTINVEDTVITNVTGAGINLRNIKSVFVYNCQIKNVGGNGITIQKAANYADARASIAIRDTHIENWANGNTEGRAIRAALNALDGLTVYGVAMIHENAPEEFVKVTGFTESNASRVKLDGNYWNGEDPTSKNTPAYFVAEGIYPTNYYASYVNNKLGYYTGISYVAQIGNVKYKTFDDAYKAAKTGDTIVLLAPVVITENTTLDLSGLTVDGNGVYPAFRVQNGATLTINGNGTVVNATDYVFVLGASDGSSAGNLVINGGTFKGQTTVVSVTKGTLTINGGHFSVYDSEYGATYMLNCYDASYKNGEAKIAVCGGTFVGFNPQNNAAEGANTNFCAAGYMVRNNMDGTWTVVKGKVYNATTGFSFATLAEAMMDARLSPEAMDVIELVDDLYESVVIIYDGVTLDLKNYTLTADYVIGFNGGYLTGAPYVADQKNALLIVDKDHVTLGKDAYFDGMADILPVWDKSQNNGEGAYVFSQIIIDTTSDNRGVSYNEETDQVEAQFKVKATKYILREILEKQTYADHGVTIVVRVSWTGEQGTYFQNYVYTDEFVRAGCGARDLIAYFGVGDREKVTMSILVITDAGVECEVAAYSMD